VADATATDGAGGGARGHFDVDELLNGGSNGFDVVLVIVSLGRLALGECRTLNEVHDDIPTTPAREAKVNLGDANDARRVGVHDPCYVSLRTAFTSDDGVVAIFDPESRLACDPDADAVPVETSFNARIDDAVVGREVCWDVRRMPDLVVCHARMHVSRGTGSKGLGDDLTLKSRKWRTEMMVI
jgi:hypothetical protein